MTGDTYNVYVGGVDPEFADETRRALNRIERKVMTTREEIIAMLDEADAKTTEIAEDLAEMAARSDIPPEVASRLAAHVEALRVVASVVPEPEEPAPDEPPV